MTPFLESIGASASYGVLHATIKSLFSDNSDELTKRLYGAVDRAADRFHDAYGNRFGGPQCTFLARHDNLKVIAKSLHFSQPALCHSDFSPKGFEGAPDATEDEINAFLQMLHEELQKDHFLDKHFSQKQLMRTASQTNQDVRQIRAMLQQALSQAAIDVGGGDSANGVDAWRDSEVVDRDHPDGWLPEQGQIYTTTFNNGATVRYMLHGELLGVEYTHPDGLTHYSDIDAHGNPHAVRLPFELGEYVVLVPEDLEVSRKEIQLADGRISVDVILKWGNRVRYSLDVNGRLVDIRVKGPHVYRHRKKVIEILPPGYLDKKARGEV